MKSAYFLTAFVAVFCLSVSGPALAGKKKKSSRTVTSTSYETESESSDRESTRRTRNSSGGSTTGTYTSGAATLDHPGRLLASNCFQCHGTNGHGMEGLAGKSASDISGDMYEMKRKTVGADIMHVYAYSLTNDQLDLVADYFSKQQR